MSRFFLQRVSTACNAKRCTIATMDQGYYDGSIESRTYFTLINLSASTQPQSQT